MSSQKWELIRFTASVCGSAFTKKSDLRTKKALKITTASRSQIIHKAPAHEYTNQRERKRGQTESLRNSVTVMNGSKDSRQSLYLISKINHQMFFKGQTDVINFYFFLNYYYYLWTDETSTIISVRIFFFSFWIRCKNLFV